MIKTRCIPNCIYRPRLARLCSKFECTLKTKRIHFSGFIFVWLVFLFNNAVAQYANDSVFNGKIISNIQLQNVDANKMVSLRSGLNLKPLTLFVFLSPECPLCQNYSGILNKFYKQYTDDVQMYGIIPGKAYSNKTIKDFKQQYNILFPLLIDNDKKLVAYLKAAVTPQVILLDNKNQLVYKGAIDNWLQALGKQRVHATEYFLQNALQQSLSNKAVLVKRTKAVGCRINDF